MLLTLTTWERRKMISNPTHGAEQSNRKGGSKIDNTAMRVGDLGRRENAVARLVAAHSRPITPLIPCYWWIGEVVVGASPIELPHVNLVSNQ